MTNITDKKYLCTAKTSNKLISLLKMQDIVREIYSNEKNPKISSYLKRLDEYITKGLDLIYSQASEEACNQKKA